MLKEDVCSLMHKFDTYLSELYGAQQLGSADNIELPSNRYGQVADRKSEGTLSRGGSRKARRLRLT
jgi:hypothetical protein